MKIDYALRRIKRVAERTEKQDPMLCYQTIYNCIKDPNPEDNVKKEQLFSFCLIAITKQESPKKAESIFFDQLNKPISILLQKVVNVIAPKLADFEINTDEKIINETLDKCYYLINYQKYNRETDRALFHIQHLVKYELDIEAFNALVDYITKKTIELKNSSDVKIKMMLIFVIYSSNPLGAFYLMEKHIKNMYYPFINDYVDYKISQLWFNHLNAKDFFDLSEKMRKHEDNSKALKELEYREKEIERLNKKLWTI